MTSVLRIGEMKTAELAVLMTGNSDKSIQSWRTKFLEGGGEMSESKQGHYQRAGILWLSKSLNKKSARCILWACSVKGKANLTVATFCKWDYENLLPNETLEPGFPRKIVMETARKLMHEMGFVVLTAKKGSYMMGMSVTMWLSIEKSSCREWVH